MKDKNYKANKNKNVAYFFGLWMGNKSLKILLKSHIYITKEINKYYQRKANNEWYLSDDT